MRKLMALFVMLGLIAGFQLDAHAGGCCSAGGSADKGEVKDSESED